jgi:7-carboxy-7-deazaguanine synthase
MLMKSLTLVNEGIFPIVYDKSGQKLSENPKTDWTIPGTIQGEGKLAGVPSLFVRLAGCNLRCMWTMPDGSVSICDTAYASFHPDRPADWSMDDLIDTIRCNSQMVRHLVVSGGEPMMQAEALSEFCRRVKTELNLHITIETNGTIFDESVAQWVDLVSLSPKLQSSDPTLAKVEGAGYHYGGTFKLHATKRVNVEAIQQWINAAHRYQHDFQLKFVVRNPDDELEIKRTFLSHLSSFRFDDVMLMPLGGNASELSQTTAIAVEMSVRNGWRFSNRLHISLFGSRTGV